MKHPQIGFFDESRHHFYFLEYSIEAGQFAVLKTQMKSLLELNEKVDTLVAFGLDAWQSLNDEWTPEDLASFQSLNGLEGHTAPSTQRDVFFWVRGENISVTFDQALKIHQQLSTIAHLNLEQRGFTYHQSLDLIGFEDGTANPKTEALKWQASVIEAGKPGEGGNLVMTQKWVHDMKKWQQIPIACQEKVVGRTKIENLELEGEDMPVDSHVSRTDLKVEGVPMKVYRRSAPFGDVSEQGLYYLAFACELIRFRSQLESMYGLTEDKTIDQLLNYSKAISGGYWFAPSHQDLMSLLTTSDNLS